jgi:hypothetical protein
MKILNFTLSRVHSAIGIYSAFGIPILIMFKDYTKELKCAKVINL